MDFSKLGQNEKLAVYGSVAVILGGLISTYGGLIWLAVLAAIGVLVVVFLPQFSAGTSLPGSKGSILAALGFVALAAGVITLLQWISVIGALFGNFSTIMLLIAIIGSAVMAWAGWQALQSEGGKWVLGGGSGSTAGATPPAAPPAPAPAEPMTSAPDQSVASASDADAATGAADPAANDPYRRDDEDRSAG